MTELTDLIAARLLSQVMRVCEDMAVPGGTPPAGEIVDAASSVVQAGLPAPGEVLPLAAAFVAFVVAGGLILLRGKAKVTQQRLAEPFNMADAQPAQMSGA